MIASLFHGVQIGIGETDPGGITLGVLLAPLNESQVSLSNQTTSSPFVATPSGGFTPYTYKWEITSGFGAFFSDDTIANPTVTINTPFPDLYDVTFRVVVTDLGGNTGEASGQFVVYRLGNGGVFIP